MSETANESGFFGDLGRERAVILGGLMLGMLLGSIDQSIVSTALPTIVGDLGGSGSISWIVTAYLITTAVTTPLYGKLSDIYGRSIIYEISIAIFLIGSALSGLAGDIPVLDDHISGMAQLAVFRAVQGVGAGGLIAMATTILGDIFSPRERGQYMSYMMLIFGAATVAGPLLGGYLTDHFTWRWIFYINIPVGLAAISVIYTQLDLPVPDETHDIDYLGAVLLTVAVAALMLVTSWGGSEYAWDSARILWLAAITIVFAVAFVVQELRVAEPIFPIHLLRRRTIAGVDVLSFMVGIGLLGGTTYLPVFLQTVLGQSATNSGLLLLPLVGGLMITAAATGQLMTRSRLLQTVHRRRRGSRDGRVLPPLDDGAGHDPALVERLHVRHRPRARVHHADAHDRSPERGRPEEPRGRDHLGDVQPDPRQRDRCLGARRDPLEPAHRPPREQFARPRGGHSSSRTRARTSARRCWRRSRRKPSRS